MMLQVGKFYRTRNGKKVGPMELCGPSGLLVMCERVVWYIDGKCFYGNTSDYDIIEEWKGSSSND